MTEELLRAGNHQAPAAPAPAGLDKRDVGVARARLSEQMRRRHVLIINRDAALLEGTRALLQDERYNVTTTSLVPTTTAMITALAPDVLVVDLALDEPELWRFVERLASAPWLRKIPVIFTAADPAMLQRANRIEHQGGGRFEFLRPFRPADLVDCVHALIGPA